MAFDNISGESFGVDVYDEVAAYKAQFAYDPYSVQVLPSSSTAGSFEAITTGWVQGIETLNGKNPYAPGGSNNTGIAPVNVNTTRDGLISAYPNQATSFLEASADATMKSLPTIYYKK